MKRFAKLSLKQWDILFSLISSTEHLNTSRRDFVYHVRAKEYDFVSASERVVPFALFVSRESRTGDTLHDEWSGRFGYKLAVHPREVLNAAEDYGKLDSYELQDHRDRMKQKEIMHKRYERRHQHDERQRQPTPIRTGTSAGLPQL